MSLKNIVDKVDLTSIASIVKMLKTLGKSNFGSEPPLKVPPPLVLVGGKLKPGMSARNLAAKTISKLEQQGIPMTDDIFGGEQNLFSLSILTMSEEIISELHTNARVDSAIAPGSIQITAVGGNAGGPVVVQGGNTSITMVNGGLG